MTMTDKALLEAAARAEGHTVDFDDLSGLSFYGDRFAGILWNPLDNDGDALRLAVRLCLTVKVEGHECVVFSNDGEFLSSVPIMGASCFVNAKEATNPYAATRRAIVRAAASLSQEKPHG